MSLKRFWEILGSIEKYREATFKREDLDCKGHMGEQICWTRLDERVLTKDSCINALDTQNLKY